MAASEKTLGRLHEVVATAFLKNNNVTADAEDNEALRDLGKALQARRKKQMPQAALDAAADMYATQMGEGLIQ